MHVLRTRSHLALWPSRQAPKKTLCGLNEWRDNGNLPRESEALRRLLDEPQLIAERFFPNRNLYEVALEDLIGAVFKWVRHPLELEPVISITAKLLEEDTTEYLELDAGTAEVLVTKEVPADVAVERFAYFSALWQEICALPQPQRVALLLSLRDEQGDTVIDFFPLYGVAGYREINRVLELGWSDEEFGKRWKGFPLDDLTIGGILGLARQEVINRRKAARQRLARRFFNS